MSEFQDHLHELFQSGPSGNPLANAKKRAWGAFCHLGLPSREQEVFRHVRLRDLYSNRYAITHKTQAASEEIEPWIYSECKNSFLVFIDGIFSEAHSNFSGLPKEIEILPLSKAQARYGSFLNQRWAKEAKEEKDPFALLNAALLVDGLFVYFPPGLLCETPLQILHYFTEKACPMLYSPRLHLYLGKRAMSQIYFTRNDACPGHWVNEVIDGLLDENAMLTATFLDQGENDLSHLTAVRAHLKKGSHFKSIAVNRGSRTARSDYHLILDGDEAEGSLSGIWLLDQKRQMHLNAVVDHCAPHTRSFQKFKGVLADTSASSFEGKIIVRKEAQKTEAYQSNPNLLLGERAMAYSKPNLEIFADDVKASHGATVGGLNQEELFYLKTRGLATEAAQKLLIAGFAQEILEAIPLFSARQTALKWLQDYLVS